MGEVKVKTTSKGLMAVIIGLGVLFLILPILLFFVFAITEGFDDGVYTNFEFLDNNDLVINNKIKVFNVNYYLNVVTDAYYVEGYIQNIDDEDIDYISIEYNLYDANNNILGTAIASINDLKENAVWKFSAKCDGARGSNVARYELSKVTTY